MTFAMLIFFTVEPQFGKPYTTIAFLVGGFTSILAGYIGMRVAVYANVRTTKECATDISNGFLVAYRGGQVLGFTLVGLALFVLQVLIIVYIRLYIRRADTTGDDGQKVLKSSPDDVKTLFEMIAGYGLGASTVALFARVGGGIFTKAADVGSDLAGKVIRDLREDDP